MEIMVYPKSSLKMCIRDRIKNDIAHVISKYMKIDTASMDIQITKTGVTGRNTKMPVLYANIPILDLKN